MGKGSSRPNDSQSGGLACPSRSHSLCVHVSLRRTDAKGLHLDSHRSVLHLDAGPGQLGRLVRHTVRASPLGSLSDAASALRDQANGGPTKYSSLLACEGLSLPRVISAV